MVRRPRQSGAALALVLMFVAIATTVGMSYLATSSINTVAAQGHSDAVRARYLAESGIDHGICLLRENPDLLNPPYGATLGPFKVDDTGETYTLSLTPTSVPGQFEIISTGISGRSEQTVSALVRHIGGVENTIEQAMILDGAVSVLDWSVEAKGDVHANGDLVNRADIEGDVTATGSVNNLYAIDGSIRTGVGAVSFPSFDPADYEQYAFGELVGDAITITEQLIGENHAIDNGWTVTEGNPAGVVISRPINGSLWLREDLDFEGTLVVHGDLVLDGWNQQLKAIEGFPVLIVTGRIYITFYCRTQIQGVVYAAGGIYDQGSTTDTTSDWQGATILSGVGIPDLPGKHTFTYDSKWTTLLNPQGWGYGGTVEVLSWDE